jgi:hypothetical protein
MYTKLTLDKYISHNQGLLEKGEKEGLQDRYKLDFPISHIVTRAIKYYYNIFMKDVALL